MEFDQLQIEINRPVATVWNVVQDVARLPEWANGVDSVTAEGPGPLQAGGHFRQTTRFLGRTLETTNEVTRYETQRRIAWKTISGPVDLEVEYLLEPTNGRTRLTFAASGQSKGIFKIADPVLKPIAKRLFEANFSTLKELMEAQEPALT